MKAKGVRANFSILILAAISIPLVAQEPNDFSELKLQDKINSVREETGRELTVISPTLTPEEIDPAVLNRLLHEINREPETVKARLGIDDDTMAELFVALTNARSFINTNEMANIRAMCQTWDSSDLIGDDRINQALGAYERRAGFTRRYIGKYYKSVLSELKYGLLPAARLSFEKYMDDRRRRMASAGNVTTGIPTQNARSGAEAVEFHCGPAR